MGRIIKFTYITQLTKDRTRLEWKAKTSDNDLIIVRFVKKYSDIAHRICTSNGFAPTLLFAGSCSNELGGFKMIIREYEKGRPLMNLLIPSSAKSLDDDISSAIKLLHKSDIVFADLRMSNILVVEKDKELHAKLLNFDWCGVHGIDTYPLLLSHNINWPDGVRSGAILRKEHDLEWLRQIKRFCKNPQCKYCFLYY